MMTRIVVNKNDEDTKIRKRDNKWFVLLISFLCTPLGVYWMFKRRHFLKIIRVVLSITFYLNFLFWCLFWCVVIFSDTSENDVKNKGVTSRVENKIERTNKNGGDSVKIIPFDGKKSDPYKKENTNSTHKKGSLQSLYGDYKKSSVNKEIIYYVNKKTPDYLENEKSIREKHSKIIHAGYSDLKTAQLLKKEILPKYKTYLNKLTNIQLISSEIANVHLIRIKYNEVQYNIIVKQINSLIRNDANGISEANNENLEVESIAREYNYRLKKLGDKYGVEIFNY